MVYRSFKYTFFIACLMLSVSCGKSKDQEIKDAILGANNYLSQKNCQPAIDLLEGMGRQNTNASYLKVLASAYACKAGYSSVAYAGGPGSDVEKTTMPTPLGGMTTYSTSLVTLTSPLSSDEKFQALQTAIDILLYAGGISSTTEPTSSERAKHFSLNQAGDINTELLFMMMVQAGRMMKVYGNTDIGGVKGNGTTTNNHCFTDYSGATLAVINAVPSLPGACKVINNPHPELAPTVSATLLRKRLCQGVVLMNSIIDVLPSVVATAGGGSIDDIKDITTNINTYKTLAITYDAAAATTALVMSQANCESDSAITPSTLAAYYALVFEGSVQ